MYSYLENDDLARGWFRFWHQDLFFPEPDSHLPRAPQLLKFPKYADDRLLHLPIRRLLNLTLFGADESHWHFPQREALSHLLLKRLALAMRGSSTTRSAPMYNSGA